LETLIITDKIVVDIGDNPPILLHNNKVAITHFESDTRQLFETKDGSYIYFKDERKLHSMTLDAYFKALMKVVTYVNCITKEKFEKALL
jgi:hypothetical protein